MSRDFPYKVIHVVFWRLFCVSQNSFLIAMSEIILVQTFNSINDHFEEEFFGMDQLRGMDVDAHFSGIDRL